MATLNTKLKIKTIPKSCVKYDDDNEDLGLKPLGVLNRINKYMILQKIYLVLLAYNILAVLLIFDSISLAHH